jgi:hypothetical protein
MPRLWTVPSPPLRNLSLRQGPHAACRNPERLEDSTRLHRDGHPEPQQPQLMLHERSVPVPQPWKANTRLPTQIRRPDILEPYGKEPVRHDAPPVGEAVPSLTEGRKSTPEPEDSIADNSATEHGPTDLENPAIWVQGWLPAINP